MEKKQKQKTMTRRKLFPAFFLFMEVINMDDASNIKYLKIIFKKISYISLLNERKKI